MFASFSFWIWGTIIAQVLAAVFNSVSFVTPARPRSNADKQLRLGFTFIYLFGAVLNWYFLKQGMSLEIWHGLVLIELIFYFIIFIMQIKFTFWPAIILTGLVFVLAAGTFFFGT